jgi:hypothetical protein
MTTEPDELSAETVERCHKAVLRQYDDPQNCSFDRDDVEAVLREAHYAELVAALKEARRGLQQVAPGWELLDRRLAALLKLAGET